MDTVKRELPNGIIAAAIGIAIEKFVLKHDLSSSSKFLGINMPKYANVALTVGGSSIIAGTLQDKVGSMIPEKVRPLTRPLVSGAMVSGLNYFDKTDTNMINSFLEGSGSTFLSLYATNFLFADKDSKKKSQK
jgi:hypothetical protein